MGPHVRIPARLQKRWREIYCNGCLEFDIASALSNTSVRRDRFENAWKVTEPNIPDDELFGLLKKAFGARSSLASKLDFVKGIWERYVRALSTCLSALWVHLVMFLCRSAVSYTLMHHLSHTIHSTMNGAACRYWRSHWSLASLQNTRHWSPNLHNIVHGTWFMVLNHLSYVWPLLQALVLINTSCSTIFRNQPEISRHVFICHRALCTDGVTKYAKQISFFSHEP